MEQHLHNLLGIEERIGSVHPIEVLSEKDIWFIVFKDIHDLDLVFVAEDDAQHDRGFDHLGHLVIDALHSVHF